MVPDPLTCLKKLVQQCCQIVSLEYSSLVRDDLCTGLISAVSMSDMRDPGTNGSSGQQSYIPLVPFSKMELLSLNDIHTALIPLPLALPFCLLDSQRGTATHKQEVFLICASGKKSTKQSLATTVNPLHQGSSNPVPEGHCPAEFSSKPDQTNRPMIF